MNTLKNIWDTLWQSKPIRVQLWNIISVASTLLIAYLINLEDKVSSEVLVQILVLGTVVIQQGLKYLNTRFFWDVGVNKEEKAELPEPAVEVINTSPFRTELDTGEAKPATVDTVKTFTPRVIPRRLKPIIERQPV